MGRCDVERSKPFKLKMQILCGDEIAFGPGKADLLEAIAREGSISGAGRALGISYRRTWQLVDMMNRCWSERLVETLHGGGRERGARVTPFGENVLAHYRRAEARLAGEAAASLAGLMRDLRPAPLPAKAGADSPAAEATNADRAGKRCR